MKTDVNDYIGSVPCGVYYYRDYVHSSQVTTLTDVNDYIGSVPCGVYYY